jgi:O-antigen/teichoic acid export membrane protein
MAVSTPIGILRTISGYCFRKEIRRNKIVEFEEIDQEQQQIIRSPLREIGRDIKWYIPAQVIPALAGFLGLAAYTRLLNPEQYGFYVLTIATVSLVTAAGFTWLNSASLRYFEEYRNKDKLSEFIATGVISLTIFFIAIAIIWYIATIILEQDLNSDFIYLLKIGILILGTQVGINFIVSVLRAGRQTRKYGIYASVNALGGLLLAISFLYFLHLGPAGILWGMIIVSGGIVSFEMIHFYKKRWINLSFFSLTLLRKLASYGVPLAGAAFGASVLSIADRFMIGFFIGSKEVGLYAAGYSIATKSVTLLYSILITATYPVIIQIFERKGKEKTRLLLERILSTYFIILMPAVLGIALLSEEIVKVFLGQPFQGASAFLPWVAGGLFCLGLTQLAIVPFSLVKKTLYLLYFVISACILNIALNLFLIPQFGGLGAAYATLLSYLAYLIITWAFSNKILPWIFPWHSFFKSIPAMVGMTITLLLSRLILPINLWALIIKIFFGGGIYIILLALFREDTCVKVIRECRNYRFSFMR